MLQILGDEGFWPQYSLEDVAWLGVPNVTKIAWPMVSFCDIPILRLREHAERYGGYGIGLCREQMIPAGLNPILYVSEKSILSDFLREIIKDADLSPDPRKRTAGMVLLGHCKPLDEKFYSECEWRFIPWVEGVGGKNKFGFFLTEKNFRDASILKEANDERRKDRLLEFWPNDVRYLLVKTHKDVSDLVSFLDSNPAIASYERTVRDMLKTRIIVLDEISSDL